MLDICDTCAFEDACPSAHFNKTESSVCAFYKSLRTDKPDGTYWSAQIAEEIADVQIMLEQMELLHDCVGLVAGFKAQKLDRLEKRLREG